MMTYQYGFIGMGNMGYAMLKGLLNTHPTEEIIFYRRSAEKRADVEARTGVQAAEDNRACAASAQYVILAVKPQQFDRVIEEIRDVITKEQVIISIAPGITIQNLNERFGVPCRIVRAMPNTPALVGAGMTGVSYEDGQFSDEEKKTIREFFESFGKMELVEERLMDAVVCASGSSPAYVYLFMEALADSAVKCGLPRNQAYQMVAQTVLGSAKLMLETGEHPAKLKDQVCSPGGTTIAGVAALEEYGFRGAVLQATDACYQKCNKIK